MLKSREFWLCGVLLSAFGASSNAPAVEMQKTTDAETVAHKSSDPTGQQASLGRSDFSDSWDAFVAWARSRALALKADESSGSPQRQFDDMAPVRNIVGNARIVALGEPAHGAHEPLAFRNRLFQFLVENLGFTAIALETGLCESRAVQEFVMGGEGEAEPITRAGFSWGFGKFDENVELVRWIRAYNEDARHRHKVRFYGIDMCGGDDAGFPHARIALDTALSYLLRASPESARSARKAIEPLITRFTNERYRSVSPAQQNDFRAAIGSLIKLFELNRVALIRASSQAEYEWTHRNLVIARELERAFRIWPIDDPGRGLSPTMYRVAAVRDATMADNVHWVLNREGSTGRLLVFAHNAHIMSAPVRGGIWDVYPQSPKTMGQQLRSMFGETLFIIGSSSRENASGLPVAIPDPGGIDEALAAVGIAHFFLDLRPAGAPSNVTAWLQLPRPLRTNFTTDLLVSPNQAFDALVFTARLTRAHPHPSP
jgi:erythromycin esterase